MEKMNLKASASEVIVEAPDGIPLPDDDYEELN